jgi:hypothetical protein
MAPRACCCADCTSGLTSPFTLTFLSLMLVPLLHALSPSKREVSGLMRVTAGSGLTCGTVALLPLLAVLPVEAEQRSFVDDGCCVRR